MHPAVQFFQFPQEIAHKQYEALRAFYLEGKSAGEVAQQFGYTLSAFYSLICQKLLGHPTVQEYFACCLTFRLTESMS